MTLPKMLPAGAFDKRVTLQSPSASKDADGQPLATWDDVATVWARVKPLAGKELVAAQAIHAEVTHEVAIRYRTGVNESMRLSYEGRFLPVRAVLDPLEQHQELRLMCSEGVRNG